MDQTGLNHSRGGYRSIYRGGYTDVTFLNAATHFLWVVNMSATVVKQQFRVHLAQSDMRVVFNMAKIAKLVFSCTTTEETEYLFIKPYADV